MKISIVTATYNSYPFIKDCLDSVKNQNLEVEYILIDGLSSDNTLDVINSDNIISKLVIEKDEGIYDALNKGVKLVENEIVGILHSDDIFASNDTLVKVLETFENTNADVVYGDLLYTNKKDTQKVIRHWKGCIFTKKMLYKGWMPAHPTVFIKKSVFIKHGFYDLNFKISADYDYMLRIFSDDSLKFVYIPEVITKMRVGGESNKSLKNIIRKMKEDYKALKKNKIKNPLKVLLYKNISKIPQFFNSK